MAGVAAVTVIIPSVLSGHGNVGTESSPPLGSIGNEAPPPPPPPITPTYAPGSLSY